MYDIIREVYETIRKMYEIVRKMYEIMKKIYEIIKKMYETSRGAPEGLQSGCGPQGGPPKPPNLKTSPENFQGGV